MRIGTPVAFARCGDLGDLVRPADVAGVEPHAVRAGVDRLERERVVEVDVGDDRDRRLAHDRLQRLDVLVARHGDAHEVGPGVGDAADLVHRGREVRRLGLRHRLDDDGRPAADLDAADLHVSLRGHVPDSRRPALVAGGSRAPRAVTGVGLATAASCRTPRARAAVAAGDAATLRRTSPRSRPVLRRDRLALELHRRRQLVAAGQPVAGDDRELLDLLDARELGVALVDRRLHGGRRSAPRPPARRAPCPRSPAARPARGAKSASSTISAVLYGRASPITQIWPMIGPGALERRLDVGRRHVLAGRVDDDLLLAVDDRGCSPPRRSPRCRPCAASRRRRSPPRSCSGALR